MARDRSAPSSPAADAAGGKPKKVKKVRWYHRIWEAFQMTRRVDPAVTWWVLLSFVGVLAVGLTLGFVFDSPVYATFVTLPFAFLAALFILARRAETAAYRQIEGQPGASLSALKTIRRGWDFAEEPVAVEPRGQELVFRGIGRPGIVLIAEGNPHRAQRLLEAERKKVARVLPNVPITLLQSGSEEGQIPLKKLPGRVRKLKPQLTKQEVAEVGKRLRALGGARLPVPKGIDPFKARPDRKGMRGR
jgi:hypothetical protein